MTIQKAALLAVCGLVIALVCAVTLEAADRPTKVRLAYQQLSNPSLESFDPPYGQWYGVDCQVATGWSPFSTGDSEPCWMDTQVFANSWLGGGWVECIAGNTCQLIVSTEPYTAGLTQQVTGLTPGVGYGFHSALLTIYQSSAQPRVDGTMTKRLGLDPTGGIDPEAPSVVWGPADDTDKVWDVQRRVAAFAQAPTMTVFIEIASPLEAGPWPFMNLSFLDSAILAQTPMVAASSPEVSPDPDFTVHWGEVLPVPGGGVFRGVDVQVVDEAAGVWQDWLIQTYQPEAQFYGELGHRYRFRTRAWQSYPNGAWLHSPYRAGGDTSTLVAWGRFAGLVRSPQGSPVPGATVSISGTGYLAETGLDGRFDIAVATLSGTYEALVGHPVWSSPPPVSSLAFELAGTVSLTWTLRPPVDAVSNGQFEQDLEGWTIFGDADWAPAVVTAPVHSGGGALKLGGRPPDGVLTGISQTIVLSNAWQPALTLWYRPVVTSSDARFQVVSFLSGQDQDSGEPVSRTVVLTPGLDRATWIPLFAQAGPPRAAVSGTVALQLRLWTGDDGLGAVVWVDEISLGGMPGGPHAVFLPLVLR